MPTVVTEVQASTSFRMDESIQKVSKQVTVHFGDSAFVECISTGGSGMPASDSDLSTAGDSDVRQASPRSMSSDDSLPCRQRSSRARLRAVSWTMEECIDRAKAIYDHSEDVKER